MNEEGLFAHLRQSGHLVSDRLDRYSKWICVLLVISMTVEVIVAVFFRYALYSPFKWAEELARLMMVWIGMLGIAIALKEGEHVGIETMVDRLGKIPKAYCLFVSHLCVGVFLVILLYWGAFLAVEAWGTILPALQIPWTWSMAAVPITAALQLIHLVPMILDDIEMLRRGGS